MATCRTCKLPILTRVWVMGQSAIKTKQTVMVQGKPKEKNVVAEPAKPGYWQELDAPETAVLGTKDCGGHVGRPHVAEPVTVQS